MLRRTVAVLACSGMLGCGSSSPSSNSAAQGSMSVNGTFSGHSLVAQDAIAEIQTQTVTGATITSANIVIANVGSLCGLAQRDTSLPSTMFLGLEIGGPGTQIAPGSYVLPGNGDDAMFASAYFELEDMRCNSTLDELGMSGTITITAASASSLSGSFDVVFNQTSSTGTVVGSADHVTGNFDAAVCSLPATDGGATHTCGS